MRRLGIILSATIGLALAGPIAAKQKLSVPAADIPAKADTSVYIVQLAGDPVASYRGNVAGLAATRPARGQKIAVESDAVRQYAAFLERKHDVFARQFGATKIYSYRYSFNGFAARMTAQQAERLRGTTGVLRVVQDELREIETNTSYEYLELTGRGGPWNRLRTGENVVVGIIDTGINPEHPSFADVRTPIAGDLGAPVPYGDAPEGWSGSGKPSETCQFGNSDFNPDDADFECNNKLLSARYYVDGFGADNLVPDEFLSARDASDHGSHVAGTAAGNYGVEADLGGNPQGIISGMAPRARIAAYKICWLSPGASNFACATSDAMAAIDQAVADGVDVLNYSIGGSGTLFGGLDDVAFLFAADAGVFVATSNGNSGPGAETVGTPAGVPWITAVGAAQDSGVFGTGVDVTAPASAAGRYFALEGAGDVSLAAAGDIAGDIVPTEPLNGCDPLTNAADLDGKIALTIRGACAFSDKYNNAAAAGARAIVVYNDGADPTRIDPLVMSAPGTSIPGVMVSNPDGALLEATAAAGDTVTGSVGPSISISLDNRIAGFSSRGPNGGAPDIIKPDVSAPGVSILAAGSPFDAGGDDDGNLFLLLNGTSMSSPHVAGIFALLKQAHPDWSAAQAKSALMTTARSNLKKTFGEEDADPFDIGSGMIVPREAFDPGLTYNAGLNDYLAFTCDNNVQLVSDADCDALVADGFPTDASDLNYPSIGVAGLVGEQTVTRTVTNAGRGPARYSVSVNEPDGIAVDVEPSTIFLRAGDSATYTVRFIVRNGATLGEWAFGDLTWNSFNGRDQVRSPIAVRPLEFVAPDAVTGSGASGSLSFDVGFGYGGDYTAGTHGLDEAQTVEGNVVDDPANDINTALATGVGVTFHEVEIGADYTGDVAFARFALFDDFTDGQDDLDLYVFDPNGSFVGSSGGGSSAERVDLLFPAPGVYIVAVHGFTTDGPDSNYTLFSWDFGLVDDRGNAVVDAPDSASIGDATINVSWSGLNAGSKYLGAVSHTGPDGLLGLTLIDVSAE